MNATMIPSEWLEPGAVLPVTAETVATLLAAVKGCTFTQGRAAGLEEIIDMLDKFGTLKYRAGCSTVKTSQELLEQAHAYRHMIHEALAKLSPTSSDAGKDDPIRELIALHAEELEGNDYAYFELARHRRTDWMAWICTNVIDSDPDRKVLAQGQGSTPEEACAAAVADYHARALSSLEAIGKGEKG